MHAADIARARPCSGTDPVSMRRTWSSPATSPQETLSGSTMVVHTRGVRQDHWGVSGCADMATSLARSQECAAGERGRGPRTNAIRWHSALESAKVGCVSSRIV